MPAAKTIKEEKLIEKLGISVEFLRDFRTLHLDEEEHYLINPLRYTPEGVKLVTAHFLGPVATPPVTNPGALDAPVVSTPRTEDPNAPRARLSPLKAAWAPEVAEGMVRPVVQTLPINNRLVVCNVGPHRNVRVLVGDAMPYVKGMVVPIDIDPVTFDPRSLITYRGRKPRRKGCW